MSVEIGSLVTDRFEITAASRLFSVFLALTSSCGKNPQQSKAPVSVSGSSNLKAFALPEDFLQCAVLASGQLSISAAWAGIVPQQNKKKTPLNHRARNPAERRFIVELCEKNFFLINQIKDKL